MTYIVVALVAQAAISGGLSAKLAERKGYSTGAWFVVGFLFGVLGLIACAGLPVVVSERPRDLDKRCPRCDELVRVKASVCRYCQYEFKDSTNATKHLSAKHEERDEVVGSIEEIAEKLHKEHPFWSMRACRELAAGEWASKTKSTRRLQ